MKYLLLSTLLLCIGCGQSPTTPTTPTAGNASVYVLIAEAGTFVPLDGAQVTLSTSTERQGSTTDRAGMTWFPVLIGQVYTLQATAAGHISVTRPVLVTGVNSASSFARLELPVQ